MELNAGLDLHSRNIYIGIMDKEFNRVFKKRVPNHLELILETLDPFRDQINGFVVEFTYNWYWLVDGLMDAGIRKLSFTLKILHPCTVFWTMSLPPKRHTYVQLIEFRRRYRPEFERIFNDAIEQIKDSCNVFVTTSADTCIYPKNVST